MPLPFVHHLTTPWGSCLEAQRLRARSRMPKARPTPRRSTLGDGCFLLLEEGMGDELGHLIRRSAWELRKTGPG